MRAAAALVSLALGFAGCGAVAPSENAEEPNEDLAVPWVRTSVEYQAATRQTYQLAARVLERLVADRAWSALPQQLTRRDLPPAVISDVDETVLDNSLYQERYGGEYDPESWDGWLAERAATAVPGAAEFFAHASALGVTAFFVTNRPCRQRAQDAAPCPQEQDTISNLAQVGIVTEPEHVMLLGETAEWGREKLGRRLAIAERYRVVMLLGDQLGDFLPCVRDGVVPPCTEAATSESRQALYEQHERFWGHGWYMLPNPMYGTWSSFLEERP